MRTLNEAFLEVALYNDMMRKVAQPVDELKADTATRRQEILSQRAEGETRRERRTRERAERKAARKAARV